MQGMIRCAVVAGLLSACDTDDAAKPDGPTGAATALTVSWASEPSAWPGPVKDGVTVDSARFAFDSLRVIGDAGPGDPRTTARMFEVRWEKDRDPPATIEFADAPVGLYSQLALEIDAPLTHYSYEIRGIVQVNGNDVEYRIEDNSVLAVTLPIDRMKLPDAPARVRVDVDVVSAINTIDFTKLQNDGGHLELDAAGMVEFRKTVVANLRATAID